MKKLIGKTVEKIYIDNAHELLAFLCSDNSIIAYRTYAECCSSTWFDSITGVEALIDQTVLTCEKVPIEVAGNRNNIESHYIEEMADYGCKLTTKKGHIDIVYRNSSNGYYGGGIDECDDINLDGMIEITEDWEA